MDTCKYIVYDDFERGYTMIMFSPFQQHVKVANCMLGEEDEIKSAGFVRMGGDGKLVCYGESFSLELKSDPAFDSVLANRLMGLDK